MQFKLFSVAFSPALISLTLLSSLVSIHSAQLAQCKSSTIGTSSKTSVHDGSLTGEYEYKHGRNQGSLYVKEQAPGKIKFALSSAWVSNSATGYVHSGQAGGVVSLKNNKGAYKSEYCKLNFDFTPGHCVVTCPADGDGFGGMNVDPNGNYKKINSKVPSKDELSLYDTL